MNGSLVNDRKVSDQEINGIEEKKFRNEAQQKSNPGKSYFVLVFLETLTTLTVIMHFVVATFNMYNVAKATTGSLISATSLRG